MNEKLTLELLTKAIGIHGGGSSKKRPKSVMCKTEIKDREDLRRMTGMYPEQLKEVCPELFEIDVDTQSIQTSIKTLEGIAEKCGRQ